MTKKRILTVGLAVAAMLVLMFVSGLFANTVARAETSEAVSTVSEESGNEAQPRGLLTQISLSIGAENSAVWAEAHNDFTLGFSTIRVYVELYSSYTYQDDYRNMILESSDYTGDLNIGQTLRTTSPTYGETKYWLARLRYKFDEKDWVIKTTQTYLIDGDGRLVG